MKHSGRFVGVLGAPLRVQLFLLVAGVLAGWALTGDKSSELPPGTRMDYLVSPLISNPIVDMVLGFGAVLLIAGILSEVLCATELDRRWYALLLVALAIGGYLGHAARILTAGGIGVNIGAIFVLFVELPVIAVVTAVLAWRTWQLIRSPEAGADRHPARAPLRSQVRLLASGALAAWWLVGDLSPEMPPGTRLDYLVRPVPIVSMSPAIDVLLGSLALALASATLLVTATTAARSRWLGQFLGALALGGLVGFFCRILTAGGIGANIGGGLVLLLGLPLLAAAALALGWRTTRLLRV
ncbi:hypothetical protein NLX83_34760 [Allokutzneria sp. A3M-2-11 16]|uniref:hypothetical protein n=1 Tax=Allokutzneria sp. A3M-2-11 16 TaxID=2962043 RepID=UPI0020B7D956|nr:hypothetical protein [Allokutzneria sp. A3M-2-11 16]MCP3804442.1 hypothetical protein [Allokutzneria sp. A3M-2-11 16]